MTRPTRHRSRQDWLEAAVVALAKSGVDGVRVEALARTMGVTKGSFYWHFTDQRALLDAVLGFWAEQGTRAIIEEVEAAGGTAAARLRRLWDVVSGPDLGPELALRDWARRDRRAAAAVAAVDGERVAYLRRLFRELGCDRRDAEARSLLLYSLLVGSYFIRASHGGRSPMAVQTDAVNLLLAPPG
ncbi:MAG: TetR/AcrR family transcriptional regulator [Deltaproteobacteria bacterium]|nr:TetR/AcrR family transcriptional regulator [Deltaproteobacteria bacterium]